MATAVAEQGKSGPHQIEMGYISRAAAAFEIWYKAGQGNSDLLMAIKTDFQKCAGRIDDLIFTLGLGRYGYELVGFQDTSVTPRTVALEEFKKITSDDEVVPFLSTLTIGRVAYQKQLRTEFTKDEVHREIAQVMVEIGSDLPKMSRVDMIKAILTDNHVTIFNNPLVEVLDK